MEQKRARYNWGQYVSYLRSDKWKRKRVALGFNRGFKCEMCGRDCRDGFEVHHKTYKRIFREPFCDLMLLCPNCHRAIEVQKRRERKWSDVYKQRNVKIDS